MSDELKPCPFCEDGYPVREEIVQNRYAINCQGCRAYGRDSHLDYIADKFWNHRPIEDKLRAENDRLAGDLGVVMSRGIDLRKQLEKANAENERLNNELYGQGNNLPGMRERKLKAKLEKAKGALCEAKNSLLDIDDVKTIRAVNEIDKCLKELGEIK